MIKTDLAILKYWRSAVADTGISDGRLNSRQLDEFHFLSSIEAEKGVLSSDTIVSLFDKVAEDVQRITVSYRPLLMRRKHQHGRYLKDDLPVDVTPIITRAEITREGRIIPNQSFIPRDILDPLPRNTFSVGSLSDLDRFLTEHPFRSEEENPEIWQLYQSHWQQMIAEVAGNWPNADTQYLKVGFGLIKPATEVAATVRQILQLSDVLIKDRPETPLLANFTRKTPRDTERLMKDPFALADRPGHSNAKFPVADQQREVLAHLYAAQIGDILAVNGPPGTGKTTMLLSAIAGFWVRAALEQTDPPLIVAASSNNQAVTNIIDAFGKDFGHGEGPFAGRWLPDINSFGLYLPAASRENKASTKYQTESFFRGLEAPDYLERARTAYLDSARIAFPNLGELDVARVIKALHQCLIDKSQVLIEADKAYENRRIAYENMQRLYGDKAETKLAQLEETKDCLTAEQTTAENVLNQWERWLADEPILLSLLGFLPSIASKRLLRARVFLRSEGASEEIRSAERIDTVDKRLKTHASNAALRARMARHDYNEAVHAKEAFRLADEAWRKIAWTLLPESDAADLLDFDRAADLSVRFPLFLLATHYWEGRWLLEMEKTLIVLQQLKTAGCGENDRCIVEQRWSRRMMLTPCAVSTFATLPGKMLCRDNATGSYRSEYLFNHIDLLIVDEAGQVLPEVAAPSFALAKRALVIGDTQQIAPISNLPDVVDTGNLIEAGLLRPEGDGSTLLALDKTGLRSRSGSTMQVAQSACRYYPYENLERGLYLFEHRRCYDEIISFCNALCYKGALRPARGPVEKEAMRPLGYLHIDGITQSVGGSRFNSLEAETIAAWLAANSDQLRARYNKRLEDIVGVVTPFGRQVREIRNACLERGIDVGEGGMTVGTVHALQGAEREVVIFSPVYSKHADGGFIDESPSMLNVAVSRAKDAFLVFGDMDTLASAKQGSPRSALARFLFEHEANELVFEVPARRDLSKGIRTLETLRDAAEHDAFLLRKFAKAQNRICIVSPWINVRTMQQVGFVDAISSARRRGLQVDIYADPKLSGGISGRHDKYAQARQILSEMGVHLHAVRQLHSKLVWMDGSVLTVGSFNWLSAHRSGEFARHETSLIYRGPHLGAEIGMLEDSLKKRILKF
jgi:hypothetical protein